jgi:hypothetical protein
VITGTLRLHPVIQGTHSRRGGIPWRKSMMPHQSQALRGDGSGQKSFDATVPGSINVHAIAICAPS